MSDAEFALQEENRKLKEKVKSLESKVWDLEVKLRETAQGAQRVLGAMNNFVLNMSHPKKI